MSVDTKYLFLPFVIIVIIFDFIKIMSECSKEKMSQFLASRPYLVRSRLCYSVAFVVCDVNYVLWLNGRPRAKVTIDSL